MSSYIPFTDAQKERAASVNLEVFLQSRGETLLPSGKEKRLARDHSITVGGNTWYDHAAMRGGGPVSFVREQYGLSYPEAMQLLLGEEGEAVPIVKERADPPRKPFVRPAENHNMRRAYAYLVRSRGISREVVNAFAKAGLLYEDAEYHNCVFIGKDEMGIARHAHKRSTNSFGKTFRINVEGGDPRYSFHHTGTDDILYVFEAPIDLLSYISLHPSGWQQHSYVACCGVSFQPVQKMLERIPGIKTVFLCLDNDEAGHAASARMAASLQEQGVHSGRLTSTGKDWNDDLKVLRKHEQAQEQGQERGQVQGQGQSLEQRQPQKSRQNQTRQDLQQKPKPGNEVQTACQTFGC